MQQTCLNGHWDFLPVYGDAETSGVPRDGWIRNTYLVPSYWTKDTCAFRKKGEKNFHPRRQWKEQVMEDGNEFLFDAFGYPNAWSKTRQGWIRRALNIDKLPGRRYILNIGAVTQYSHLFVNGKRIAENRDPSLPFITDITDHINAGENEIAVFLRKYDRDERGRVKACAAGQVHAHAGIWQDVWLIERPDVYLDNVTIRTSTRAGTITAIFSVRNASKVARTINIAADVVEWKKGGDPIKAVGIIDMPATTVTVPANGAATWDASRPFEEARRWSPESPFLYQMRTTLCESNEKIETTCERFGFREIWIQGPDIMLNDHPLRIFSDWGHKFAPYHLTEGWVRKWFGMLRDGNMNHSRLHVHPHMPRILDLADEEGILITDEAALYGSGMEHAADWPPLWDMARDHVRRLVKRDKNHPCLVMWSVENEMRWNRDETPLTSKELPRLRLLFNELDPTRPAYHEGDSSLWDERKQDIVSRHYGRTSFGYGWWDRKQPLHVGEMSLYHYAGPNNTLHLIGDEVYESYEAVDRGSAEDTALSIEAGRALGICAFGPWNISSLENLRMEPKKITLKYPDLSAPGVKPRYVNPHTAEFAFWKQGKGYTPSTSFAIQKRAFRPLAVIDTSGKNAYFAGARFGRELTVCNDTAGAQCGILAVSLMRGKSAVKRWKFPMKLERGKIESRTIDWTVPRAAAPGVYRYRAEFIVGKKRLDAWSRSIRIAHRALSIASKKPFVEGRVAVFGGGSLRAALDALTLDYRYVQSLAIAGVKDARILIIEKDSLNEGVVGQSGVRDFVHAGGRVIVLEQTYGLFPTLLLEKKQALTAFTRAVKHPVLAGLGDADLKFWGDEPYTAGDSPAAVANVMYRKNDGRNTLFLVESGEGGFGNGNLDYTPLFEHTEGKGLVLACQLRVTDKIADTPAAEMLLLNMLSRAASYEFREAAQPVIVDGNDTAGIRDHAASAKQGKTVIVNCATAQVLAAWSRALKVSLKSKKLAGTYQAVRAKKDPLLNGVCNEDTCGIETWTYAPGAAENHMIGADFLAHARGLEPLLETPTRSAFKELYVDGGMSESLRAYTVTTTLFVNKPDKAVVLGRVKCGRGAVVFNCFSPPFDKRMRFMRLPNRLLANLGVVSKERSLFDGKREIATSIMSGGFPREILVYDGPCDSALKSEIISCTLVGDAKIAGKEFKESTPTNFFMTSNDGLWKAAGYDLSHDLFIYYCINSPSERKNVLSNLGIINPEVFTFMDCKGQGVVELTVNGHTYEPVTMVNEEATVADISLEQGENRIVARWKPESEQSTLQMKWRNIMREPEVGFFMYC